MKDTAVYTDGVGFKSYVDLPGGFCGHNIIKVNETHFLLHGGIDGYSSGLLFDRAVERWTSVGGPDLGECSYAGLVTYPSGENAVVVAGGDRGPNSFIFDLDTETWRSGPDLPTHLARGASVQFQDSFLVVGGIDLETTVPCDSIYKFVVSPEEGWLELPHKCRDGPSDAILVPQDFIECNL